MSRIDEVYKPALSGKNIPILPLDNKWYKMMSGLPKSEHMSELEEEIKELLKEQGRYHTSVKDIKRLKKKLMNDIVGVMEDEDAGDKQGDIKKQLEECNQKIDEYNELLADLPKRIDEVNYELMLETMAVCYEVIGNNTDYINEVTAWIKDVRIELKKNIVRKQERELKNHDLYSYMHDIFGPNVIDIFDMKYNPETEHVVKPRTTNEANDSLANKDATTNT